MTSRSATRREHISEQLRENAASARQAQTRRSRRRGLVVSSVVVVAIVGVIAAMMATSRPTSSAVSRTAPDFTLATTAGAQVHLADYRGRNVVLYFSEGAGCGACLQQMAAIEKDKAAFTQANTVVLPIVMNTAAQISRDMATYGVTTPFLLDTGAASRAYGMLGHGMHAGLPGHGFVLIDATGTQRWSGEYPSMWLTPADLLSQVRKHLAA
jgi:peroxiredoxin